jgi:CRISPR-associated protein Cas5, subtype I-C/DVULG
MYNQIEFKVKGDYALFTDPVTRIGGMKSTYMIPTYQSLIGIISSCYWKPTFFWVIDEMRVMKNIQMQAKATTPAKYNYDGKGPRDLVMYTYLKDVEYQVKAHFEWDLTRPDLAKDRDDRKHSNIAKRYLEKGGKRAVFLGTTECGGYIEPCAFGEGKGDYDDIGLLNFGCMFHSFDYPSSENNILKAKLWLRAEMNKGIVKFPRPDDTSLITKEIKEYTFKKVVPSPERELYEREDLI